ncbi:MAG TPA: hypothetical protein VFF23_12730, partial [Hanamia sp.]|nr:hypothetical protein [Hanamia sp.]
NYQHYSQTSAEEERKVTRQQIVAFVSSAANSYFEIFFKKTEDILSCVEFNCIFIKHLHSFENTVECPTTVSI